MTLAELLNEVEKIPDSGRYNIFKLKNDLIINYQASVKQSLKKILESKDSDEQKYSKLETFLEKNWESTKGSLLSYTSINNTEVTKVLCKASELICEFKNSKLDTESLPFVPLQFLMPGIELESMRSDYRSLKAIELLKFNKEEEQELLQLKTEYANAQLPEFSEKESDEVYQWEQSRLRVEAKAKATGVFDDSKISKIEKDLYDKIKIKEKIERYNSLKEKLEDKLEQEKLYHNKQDNIDEENLYEKKDYYLPDTPLEVILKTFVLNEDFSSLVPVSVILEDEDLRPYDMDAVHAIYAASNETSKKETIEFTNQRIRSHSDETLSVHNAEEKLRSAKDEKNNFLDNLEWLCNQLKFNDAYSGAGRGDNAGKGAYPAIIAFKEYYDSLGYQLRQWKDDQVFQERFIYIKLNDNPAKKLTYAVKSKDADAKQGIIKQETIEAFFSKDSKDKNILSVEQAKDYKEEILKVIIDQGNASLEDEEKKKIPTELKSEIDKLLSLSSDPSKNKNATENIETCIANRRAALEKLMSSEDQKQLLRKINISDIFKQNLIEELESNLKIAKDALRNKLQESDGYQGKDSLDISVKLLEEFNVDFKIQNLNELVDIVKGLTTDEISSLCEKDENFEQFIGPIKNNIENLIYFVLDCSEDNLRALLKVISKKGRITDFFDSAQTLGIVINFASNNAKTKIILEALKNNLKDIIKSGYDFGLALTFLNETQITTVCAALKNNLKDIIKSGQDFGNVLQYLNQAKITTVCAALKDNLKDIIKSGEDFGDALEYLNDAQRTAVLTALKDNLKDIIKSGQGFGNALQYLSDAQRTVVLIALKDNLKDIIKSGYDFGLALTFLNETQITTVCAALKNNLKDIIKSGQDFGNVLQYLNEDKRTEVLTELKDNLKDIIKSGQDFGNVLQYLNEDKRTEVLTELKDNLKDIIKSGQDFGNVLQYLNKAQRTAVLTELKDNLKDIIKSGEDFGSVLLYLNEIQVITVCAALKDNLKDIIKSKKEFTSVFELFKSYFPEIQDELELSTIHSLLANKQYDVIDLDYKLRDYPLVNSSFHLNKDKDISVRKFIEGNINELMFESKTKGEQDIIIESLKQIGINVKVSDDLSQGESYSVLPPEDLGVNKLDEDAGDESRSKFSKK